MKTIRQILDEKGHAVWSVEAGTSVLEAMRMMSEKRVGALVVTRGGAVAGIVSERDYARKMILQSRAPGSTPVAEIMSSELITVSPEDPVEHCMSLMTEQRVRHLPVLEGDALLGLISIGDVVKAQLAEQQREIDELKNYISG